MPQHLKVYLISLSHLFPYFGWKVLGSSSVWQIFLTFSILITIKKNTLNDQPIWIDPKSAFWPQQHGSALYCSRSPRQNTSEIENIGSQACWKFQERLNDLMSKIQTKTLIPIQPWEWFTNLKLSTEKSTDFDVIDLL